MRYDAAVIGLGGMGSAALAHLAGRGLNVVGIERFERLHDRGGSTGETRIIRKAYYEHPAYVPLLDRAYVLWRELEAKTDSRLLDLIGLLTIGMPDRECVAGTLKTARLYELPVDELDDGQILRRFPGTKPRPGEVGLIEHQAGVVLPAAAIAAHLDLAAQLGAEMRFNTRVTARQRKGESHHLTLGDGTEIEAARLVFCAGAWSEELLPELTLPIVTQRNVQIWFEPMTYDFDYGLFPVFLVDRADLPAPLYGFPAIDRALKAALHGYGPTMDADHIDRRIHDEEVTVVREALEGWMPDAATGYLRGKACLYDLTPDRNFIVDRVPSDPSLVLACGFSGHGFKFCPVIGEILADLAIDGGTRHDVGFLSLGRFAAARS